jgi:hypothetical protein
MKKIKQIYANKDGWTPWQHVVMKGYLMQCCGCDLVHEVEFSVWKVIEDLGNGRHVCELAGPEYRVELRMKKVDIPQKSKSWMKFKGTLPVREGTPKKLEEPIDGD